MAYVYQHIRKDTNQIFYIGIGQNNNNFKRAYSKFDRNKYWVNISKKTDYEVKILIDNISWVQACEIETLLIKQFGRIDLGTGLLTNMTDGGDGGKKMLFTNEMRQKQRLKKKCIPIYSKCLKTKEIKYFQSINEASNILNIFRDSILKCLKGQRVKAKGYQFSLLNNFLDIKENTKNIYKTRGGYVVKLMINKKLFTSKTILTIEEALLFKNKIIKENEKY